MKIKADRRAAHGEPLDQDPFDELLGGEAGKRRVEGEHDRAVEAGRGEEPQLAGLVGQAEQRLVRIEEGARMRLEGQRRRRPAQRLGAANGGADHGAVAAVHAVEIADGDDRAAQGVIGRDIAHDPETLGRHRVPKVKRNLPA